MFEFLLTVSLVSYTVINQQPDCNIEKCIALTFDDGPNENTTKLLDIFDRYSLVGYKPRATFYVVGQNLQNSKYQAILTRAFQSGHEIANHSWDHKSLAVQNPSGIQNSLNKTQSIIFKTIGENPTTFRPPYGATNSKVVGSTKLRQILWDIDTSDWKHRNKWKTLAEIKKNLGPNKVVLMYDIHASTVEAVPYILETLKKKVIEPLQFPIC